MASDPVKKYDEQAVTMPAVNRQPAALTKDRSGLSFTRKGSGGGVALNMREARLVRGETRGSSAGARGTTALDGSRGGTRGTSSAELVLSRRLRAASAGAIVGRGGAREREREKEGGGGRERSSGRERKGGRDGEGRGKRESRGT
eukprot:scaffold248378_cov33-Tisochrysis_lutea.AAC.1